MTATGDICLVSPATVAALDALLLLAVQKASEVIASGALEPKDTVAAVKVIAEATKAASDAVSKGNGIAAPPSAHPASSETSPADGPPIYTLNDAVAAVCERDADTKALVPWARVICRIHRLCNMVEEQIAEHRGEPIPEPVHKTTNQMAEELAEKYDVPFSPSRMPAYETKLRDYERKKKARQKAERAAKREASKATETENDTCKNDISADDYPDEEYPDGILPPSLTKPTILDVYEEMQAADPNHPLHAFRNPDGTLRSHDAIGNPRPRYYPDKSDDDDDDPSAPT
jgi:hypothetical protein